MNKLFGTIVLSMLLMCGTVHAAEPVATPVSETPKATPKAPEVGREQQAEPTKTQHQEKEKAVDACGGAANYIGLRILAKGETLAPGSRKVDVSKLPQGTRVYDAKEAHPQPNSSDASNPKRLNLIIDYRNVIAEAFCG